jgi:PKD domain
MRRYSLTVRRLVLAVTGTLVVSLSVAASASQAIVVTDGGTEAGVSLVPSTRGGSLPAGVSAVTSGASCTDPWLSGDLGGPAMPSDGLCYGGGSVIHKNETFALTWDNQRAYWSQTRGYVEQFLRDVADASGSLGSPFALTTQYSDNGGKAQNASSFGGGCVDYGSVGGSACEYGSPTGAGHDFPSSACAPAGGDWGDSFVSESAVVRNDVCLTDSQLQGEVSTMVSQTGIVGRTQPGYTPLVSLLLPPGVETCLDTSRTLCSANANLTPPPPVVSTSSTGGTIQAGTYLVEITYVTAGGEQAPSAPQAITTTGGTSTITIASPPPTSGVTGWYVYVTQPNGFTFTRQGGEQTVGIDDTETAPPGAGVAPPNKAAFCSYHSQVNVGGTEVAYVVQPWTAGTGCDEPGLPSIPSDPTPQALSIAVGSRLVSPLSQSELAAIVNPGLNGWVNNATGDEIDDNGGCVPEPRSLDSVTVGSSSQNPYFLQREFDNAAALEFEPNTYFGCAPNVILSPQFVVPSAVDQGDEVEFDGSATASTLIVPSAGYAWNFGDGSTATGPSVEHSYGKGGTYNVTLTVTDRGGDTNTLTQTIQVLGSGGQPVFPPSGGSTGGGGGSGSGSAPSFNVHLQLLPQSLKAVLRNGISVRVSSNLAASGIATVSITRASAKKAHIQVGHSKTVRIGLGTVSSIQNGTVTLHLHLSKSMSAKLSHLHVVAMTIRLALVASGDQRFAIDAAGRY